MPTDAALPVYVIDTSSLVNVRDQLNDDAQVWAALLRAIDSGRLKTVRQVLDELQRRFPDIYERVKGRKKKMMIPDADLYTSSVVSEVQEIQRLHPRLYRRYKSHNSADPFLIAAAKVGDYVVVTDEKVDGHKHKHKIPYVCRQRNVGVCDLSELLTRIG